MFNFFSSDSSFVVSFAYKLRSAMLCSPPAFTLRKQSFWNKMNNVLNIHKSFEITGFELLG